MGCCPGRLDTGSMNCSSIDELRAKAEAQVIRVKEAPLSPGVEGKWNPEQ